MSYEFSRGRGLRASRGFTLFELLLVVAIGVILATSATILGLNYRRGKEFSLEREKIKTFLRTAQERSVTQFEDRRWGVHFDNVSASQSFYAIFHGSEYSALTAREVIYLPASVKFAQPIPTQALDIVFSKLTGFTAISSKVVIQSVQLGSSLEINVSSKGIITEVAY